MSSPWPSAYPVEDLLRAAQSAQHNLIENIRRDCKQLATVRSEIDALKAVLDETSGFQS